MRPINHLFTSLIVSFIITCFAQPAFSSFTKLDSFGNKLPDNAREWVMVKDNYTGLMWEVKHASDDSPNYNNPHDPDNTYTWYDSNPATNGGNAGINGELTDTEDFIAAINNNGLGGFTDWRMPTNNELLTIIKHDVDSPPTVDTTYFKNTVSDYYWTATPVSDYPEQARKVNFYDGKEGYHEKSGAYRARAVRSTGIIMLPGSLMVYIYPQPAIDLGALWRVDGGDWQNSGATVSNLRDGNHLLEFYEIEGWVAPSNRNVVIENGQPVIENGLYTTTASGAITVSLSPQEAVEAGAMWRVDGGDWQNSGITISNLAAGNHSLEFYDIHDIAGWIAPLSRNVVIEEGQIKVETGIYTKTAAGSLTVNLSPQDAVNSGALWRLDGGDWQNSVVKISNLRIGNHTLEFKDIEGWTAPLSQNVVILDGQTTTVAGVYTQQVSGGSLIVTISPQDALNAGAMWRVDGGDWQNSGVKISNLSIGNHTLEFKDIEGWIAPLSQNIVIEDGQTKTVAGVYTQQVSSLIVTISPQDALNAGAMWRVDGGDWQNSGVKISNLSIGNHTLEFKDIAGWTNPSSQIVTIRDGENTIVPVRYVKSAPTNLTDIKDISNIIDQIDDQSDITNITDKLTDNVNTIQENIPEDTTTQPSNELVDAINTTTGNIGNIIDKSLNLFKKDEISLEQVLKPLELLDGIIDLGGKTAKSGGAISIEKVSGSMESVENLIELAISKGATSEQVKKNSENINNILGNIPDVMNAVKITEDVIKILGPIKGVTGAGIKSALKGNSNPSNTVGTMGEIIVQGLREASDAIIVINTGEIIKSAGNIVNHSVNVLQTDTTDKTVINNTLDVLQIELGKMIEQTASNIKDKPVKAKSLNSFAGVTSKSSGIFSGLDDFVYVMDNVSGLTTSMIRAKSVLKSDLTGKMQNLSLETIKNILPAFVSGDAANRFAAVRNDSDIQKLLNDYPQLLNEFLKIISINLTGGMVITKSDIEQIVKGNSSLTEEEKKRLVSGLPEIPRFDQDIIQSGRDALSLVDLLQKELDTLFQDSLLEGTKVEVVSTKSLQLMIILKNQSIGLNMPLYVQDARVVSSLIPQGLHILPEGTIILVRNGIAGIITPAPLDAVDTLLSADALLKIKSLFGSAKKEISDVKISNSGNLTLKFKDGSKFSGSFGYGTVKEGDGNFDAGTSIYIPQGTDPATEAYSVLVVYEDGSTQQLTSSVSALEQLVDVLDTLAAGSYTLDRATGIFNVLGARFKPSYLIEPITTSDIAWFNTNKDNIYSIAWETNDYNSDGAVDLKMWTADGKQVIYTVIQ